MMATDSAFAHLESQPGSHPHGRRRLLIGFGAATLVVIVIAAAVVLLWSGAALTGDATALARVSVQPFGGSIERVEAFAPGGRHIPLAIDAGRLTPLHRLKPGERVSVEVLVRRPSYLSWALGATRTEHLTLTTPVAHVSDRWMTVHPGSPVRVSFDQPVSTVAHGSSSLSKRQTLTNAQSVVSLGRQPVTGTTEVATAPRSWETLGHPMQVSWFPPSHAPVMVALPAAGTHIGPATKLYITFSKPISDVFGSSRPRLSPSTPGHWYEANSHTLAFAPAGMGVAFGSHVHVQLPHSVAVTSGSGGALHMTSQIEWIVPPGSTLRLQQLLAQAGYLPLDWHPTGAEVARTPSAEAQAAVDPPSGAFSWRYGNTPHQLQALWSAGQENTITRGALMKFEDENGMTVDGLAGAAVWRKLIDDAIAKQASEEWV